MTVKSVAYKVALCAIMTATLELGKVALMWAPNIEIVTILIVVYATVFGLPMTMLSTLAWVFIEGALWGLFQPWWWGYLIYWPLLVVVSRFGARNCKNEFIAALVIAFTTFCFGIITSAIDSFVYNSSFFTVYIVGIGFYVTHILCNFLMVFFAYKPLVKVLNRTIRYQQPAQPRL